MLYKNFRISPSSLFLIFFLLSFFRFSLLSILFRSLTFLAASSYTFGFTLNAVTRAVSSNVSVHVLTTHGVRDPRATSFIVNKTDVRRQKSKYAPPAIVLQGYAENKIFVIKKAHARKCGLYAEALLRKYAALYPEIYIEVP